jgi:hypothetical protein
MMNIATHEHSSLTPSKAEGGFDGPLFLVGLPRSGTKLLRELLNNHSEVCLTIKESNCIPYFYHRMPQYGRLQDPRFFDRFYQDFSKTKFFKRLDESSGFINKDSWAKKVTSWSYAGVLEAYYQAYAHHFNKRIWGDKTPSYLVQVPLLKKLFPVARFIHIVRDARDQALSINKVYGKNIFTSAQRWNDGIVKFRRDVKKFVPSDFLEIRYEDLIDLTEMTMRKVCAFLGIQYEPAMSELNKRIEFISGAAMESKGILKKNYGKWKTEFPSRSLQKFERICGVLLAEYGYETSYDGEPRRLTRLEVGLYTGQDFVNQLLFELRYRHLKEGLKGFLQLRRKAWFYRDPVEADDD